MSISIISIQSQVAFGHVGNSAAVLPMQLAGLDVAAVPTTLLSNHPRHPSVHGQVLDADLLAGLLLGVEERGALDTARLIVTGYLGSRENVAAVADFISRAKAHNPALLYICDPVIGDAGSGVFVRPGVAEAIAENLLPLADILTPNDFEFGYLAKTPITDLAGIIAGRGRIRQKAPGTAPRIVITGCALDDTPANALDNIVLEGTQVTRVCVPRLQSASVGTGDLFTGIVAALLAQGAGLVAATDLASSTLTHILERTVASGEPHMWLGSCIDILIAAMRPQAMC